MSAKRKLTRREIAAIRRSLAVVSCIRGKIAFLQSQIIVPPNNANGFWVSGYTDGCKQGVNALCKILEHFEE